MAMWGRLAFAFANALAKRDMSHCAPTSDLKEVVVTSVTTVVSLTLLRARQGERLAFAFANALAKRDTSRARTSALKEVAVTGVTTVVSLTLLRARQGVVSYPDPALCEGKAIERFLGSC